MDILLAVAAELLPESPALADQRASAEAPSVADEAVSAASQDAAARAAEDDPPCQPEFASVLGVQIQAEAPSESPSTPASQPTMAPTFDWRSLVDHDLWASVPADIDELLSLLPRADLYVQDEVDARLHPTLTRIWSRKGRRGQRLVRAPGQSNKFVAFAAVDWREGWTGVAFGLRRTADIFCLELDGLVERSQQRGRIAIVLVDNARIHTAAGSKLVRETLKRHGDKLRLVYTPSYDPESNPTERLWPPFRRAVTHNHSRDDRPALYRDAEGWFAHLDVDPNEALQHIGSPFAKDKGSQHQQAAVTLT